jgi:hypothetical protein
MLFALMPANKTFAQIAYTKLKGKVFGLTKNQNPGIASLPQVSN